MLLKERQLKTHILLKTSFTFTFAFISTDDRIILLSETCITTYISRKGKGSLFLISKLNLYGTKILFLTRLPLKS